MNELGDLRPSQLDLHLWCGCTARSPNTSALILGLDDWDTRSCTEIGEDRLLGAIHDDSVHR